MKVLNIMLSRGLGGIEQAFVDYYFALQAENFHVTNVTSSFAKINSILRNQTITIPNLGNWDLISKVYLQLIINRIEPDIIIAHGRRSIRLIPACKAKIIGVAHNYNIKDLLICDYVIALTNHMKEYLITHNYAKEKVAIIPNMIKIDELYYSRQFHQPLVIGTCGRFVKKKAINIFLYALAELKATGYIFKAKIGGDGVEKDHLIQLCNNLNLTSEVEFSGWVKNKKDFFQNIDIFCLPSLHEPFGIILLEAMKYSLPIIATKTEGPIEILEDGSTAILIEKNNPNELAKSLAYLINNPQKAVSYAHNAYNMVAQNYSTQVVARKLGIFIKSMISNM